MCLPVMDIKNESLSQQEDLTYCQSNKMVKHTQTICWQQPTNSFECV